jgi:hypothetical protein
MMKDYQKEITSFLNDWPDSSPQCRQAFVEILTFIRRQEGSSVEFHARPEITYSLRAVHHSQTGQSLYALVDVIEDEPRWLSVCFYNEMVTDPQELGDCVPGGLLGEDGLCFDTETATSELLIYLKERIVEAYRAVQG